MIVYNLYKNPNYSVVVSPEGSDYRFEFRYFQGLTYVTIYDYNDKVISGPMRVVNGQWLILSQARNYNGAGNFVIIDKKGHYPRFYHFADRCELRYYTADELKGTYDI